MNRSKTMRQALFARLDERPRRRYLNLVGVPRMDQTRMEWKRPAAEGPLGQGSSEALAESNKPQVTGHHHQMSFNLNRGFGFDWQYLEQGS